MVDQDHQKILIYILSNITEITFKYLEWSSAVAFCPFQTVSHFQAEVGKNPYNVELHLV